MSKVLPINESALAKYVLELNDTSPEIADEVRVIEYAKNRLEANPDDKEKFSFEGDDISFNNAVSIIESYDELVHLRFSDESKNDLFAQIKSMYVISPVSSGEFADFLVEHENKYCMENVNSYEFNLALQKFRTWDAEEDTDECCEICAEVNMVVNESGIQDNEFQDYIFANNNKFVPSGTRIGYVDNNELFLDDNILFATEPRK